MVLAETISAVAVQNGRIEVIEHYGSYHARMLP
jgi:hypothetical protein